MENLSIKESYSADGESKGRGIFCEKDFNTGEMVLKTSPIAATLLPEKEAIHCLFCFHSQEDVAGLKLSRCSKCKNVFYCSVECQKKDWKLGHCVECQKLQQISPNRPTQSVKLMSRIIYAINMENEKGYPLVENLSVSYLKRMISHRSKYPLEKLEIFSKMVQLVVAFVGIGAVQKAVSNPEELIEFFCKFSCNNFNILDEEMRDVGIGLYPLLALVNHDCNPNCVVMFNGRDAVIRAIEPISKGTELTIAYVEVANTTAFRQEELRNCFFFLCECDRCLHPTSLEACFIGYSCARLQCDGLIQNSEECPTFTCIKCGQQREAAEIESLESNGTQQLRYAQELRRSGKLLEAKDAFIKAYHILKNVFHRFNLQLYKLVQNLIDLTFEMKDWKTAESFCRKSIKTYEAFFQPNWPLLGLQYFLIGKLYWYLENTEKCLPPLKKAAKILKITHGIDSSKVKELERLISEAELELYQKHA